MPKEISSTANNLIKDANVKSCNQYLLFVQNLAIHLLKPIDTSSDISIQESCSSPITKKSYGFPKLRFHGANEEDEDCEDDIVEDEDEEEDGTVDCNDDVDDLGLLRRSHIPSHREDDDEYKEDPRSKQIAAKIKKAFPFPDSDDDEEEYDEESQKKSRRSINAKRAFPFPDDSDEDYDEEAKKLKRLKTRRAFPFPDSDDDEDEYEEESKSNKKANRFKRAFPFPDSDEDEDENDEESQKVSRRSINAKRAFPFPDDNDDDYDEEARKYRKSKIRRATSSDEGFKASKKNIVFQRAFPFPDSDEDEDEYNEESKLSRRYLQKAIKFRRAFPFPDQDDEDEDEDEDETEKSELFSRKQLNQKVSNPSRVSQRISKKASDMYKRAFPLPNHEGDEEDDDREDEDAAQKRTVPKAALKTNRKSLRGSRSFPGFNNNDDSDDEPEESRILHNSVRTDRLGGRALKRRQFPYFDFDDYEDDDYDDDEYDYDDDEDEYEAEARRLSAYRNKAYSKVYPGLRFPWRKPNHDDDDQDDDGNKDGDNSHDDHRNKDEEDPHDDHRNKDKEDSHYDHGGKDEEDSHNNNGSKDKGDSHDDHDKIPDDSKLPDNGEQEKTPHEPQNDLPEKQLPEEDETEDVPTVSPEIPRNDTLSRPPGNSEDNDEDLIEDRPETKLPGNEQEESEVPNKDTDEKSDDLTDAPENSPEDGEVGEQEPYDQDESDIVDGGDEDSPKDSQENASDQIPFRKIKAKVAGQTRRGKEHRFKAKLAQKAKLTSTALKNGTAGTLRSNSTAPAVQAFSSDASRFTNAFIIALISAVFGFGIARL